MAQPSPYTPGEIARDVPGRAALLNAIAGDIARLTTERRIVGRLRAFHGPRGYGKTSLLRAAESWAHAQGVDSIWVTAEEGAPLAHDLLASFEEAAHRNKLGRDVRSALDGVRLSLSAGLPGNVAKAEVSYAVPQRGGLRPSQTREFEQLIAATTASLQRAGHRGLVLFVDEIQNSDQRGLQLLSYGLAHLAAERPALPFAVMVAGLPSTPVVITSAVSNSERFAYSALLPLPDLDAKQALADPAYALGVTWEPDALTEAAAWAAGYPYSVQLAGHETWTAARFPEAGSVMTLAHARAGITAAAEELRHLHAARLGRIHGDVERQLLFAMASLGDGPVERAAVAQRMGRTSSAISNQRAALIGKGLIEPVAHGQLAFTVPGFAEFLRGEAEGP